MHAIQRTVVLTILSLLASPAQLWATNQGVLELDSACTPYYPTQTFQQFCMRDIEIRWHAYEDRGNPFVDWSVRWQLPDSVAVDNQQDAASRAALPATIAWAYSQLRPSADTLFYASVDPNQSQANADALLLLRPAYFTRAATTDKHAMPQSFQWQTVFLHGKAINELEALCSRGKPLTKSAYLMADEAQKLFAGGFSLQQLRLCQLSFDTELLDLASTAECGLRIESAHCFLNRREQRQQLLQLQNQWADFEGKNLQQTLELRQTLSQENRTLFDNTLFIDTLMQAYTASREQLRDGINRDASRFLQSTADLELASKYRGLLQSDIAAIGLADSDRFASSFVQDRLRRSDRAIQRGVDRGGQQAIAAINEILAIQVRNHDARERSLSLATRYLDAINGAIDANNTARAEQLIDELLHLNLSEGLIDIIVKGLKINAQPPVASVATETTETDDDLRRALEKAEQARLQLAEAESRMNELESRIKKQQSDSSEIVRLRNELRTLRQQGRSEDELAAENALLSQLLTDRENSLGTMRSEQAQLREELAQERQRLNRLDADKQNIERELQQVNSVLKQFGLDKQSIEKFPTIRNAITAGKFDLAIELMIEAKLIAPNPGFLERIMIKQGLEIMAKINKKNQQAAGASRA